VNSSNVSALLTPANTSVTPFSPASVKTTSETINSKHTQDTHDNALKAEIATSLGLYAVSSTAKQLVCCFPRKQKYTVAVGEIDLSEDVCAISIEVSSFERVSLIEKFLGEGRINKILEDSSSMLYSLPARPDQANEGFSFWIFTVAKISSVRDKIHESHRPADAEEKDAWADVVAFDYVEAVERYVSSSAKRQKKMKEESLK
jgi:hypothetical protein